MSRVVWGSNLALGTVSKGPNRENREKNQKFSIVRERVDGLRCGLVGWVQGSAGHVW